MRLPTAAVLVDRHTRIAGEIRFYRQGAATMGATVGSSNAVSTGVDSVLSVEPSSLTPTPYSSANVKPHRISEPGRLEWFDVVDARPEQAQIPSANRRKRLGETASEQVEGVE